jgi:general stress protein 26
MPMKTNEFRDEMLELANKTVHIYMGTLSPTGDPRIEVVIRDRQEGLCTFRFATFTHQYPAFSPDNRACLYFSDDMKFETLRLDGNYTISREETLRHGMWADYMNGIWKLGADDPDYCVLEFRATGGYFRKYATHGDFFLVGDDVVWK